MMHIHSTSVLGICLIILLEDCLIGFHVTARSLVIWTCPQQAPVENIVLISFTYVKITDMLAVPLIVNKPLKHCWDATEGCKWVSNPSYNECDELMVSFMMYTVSDSNK
jgi:hypothetical protein